MKFLKRLSGKDKVLPVVNTQMHQKQTRKVDLNLSERRLSPIASEEFTSREHSGRAENAGRNVINTTYEQNALALEKIDENVPVEWKVGDTILGIYEVKEIYTSGGMGLVYKVHHRLSDIELAVKCPRADMFYNQKEKDDFISECENWIGLGIHSNIVACRYVRTLGGVPRIFAEHIEGGSLEEWIQTGRLYEDGPETALKRILDIAIQTACGLGFAHRQGLIHQDMKPSNVMMTPDAVAKVNDFGLARARMMTAGGNQLPDKPSLMASFAGMTPAYCSPEQKSGRKLTEATDIWSWGVSILEMFTGEMSWHDGTKVGAALEHYLKKRHKRAVLPEMPASLPSLLRDCFAVNPHKRPRHFDCLVDRLKEVYFEATGCQYGEPQVSQQDEGRYDSSLRLGVSLFEVGQFTEAARHLKEAVSVQPTSAMAWLNLGFVYLNHGNYSIDHAMTSFREAIRAGYSHGISSDKAVGIGYRSLSIGTLCEHWMSLWDIRIDLKNGLAWITGDTGISFDSRKDHYVPYTFQADNAHKRDLPPFAVKRIMLSKTANSRFFLYAPEDPPLVVEIEDGERQKLGIGAVEYNAKRKGNCCRLD